MKSLVQHDGGKSGPYDGNGCHSGGCGETDAKQRQGYRGKRHGSNDRTHRTFAHALPGDGAELHGLKQ
jgi:hypothetical protein